MKPAFLAWVATLAILSTSTAFAETGQSCDRACLLGIADAYFAALTAHDPAMAPLAPNAKFTEQTQVLKVGDGPPTRRPRTSSRSAAARSTRSRPWVLR